MSFELRDYQQAAVSHLWAAVREGVRAPLVCLPTGAGKSPVVADLCRTAAKDWKGKVVVLVHVRELVEQLADSVRRHWGDPFCPLGIMSAGLRQKSKDLITVGNVQSCFRKACDFGKLDLIIIDEAHRVPPDGEGMYRTFIEEAQTINPNVRVVGLTATPYRLGHGLVYGEGGIFDKLVYDAGVKPLIDKGHLCKLRGKDGGKPDLAGVHRRGGDYISSELEAALTAEGRVASAVDEILRHSGERKAWLVFCCGVSHATLTRDELRQRGIDAEIVTGETPEAERDDIVKRYKDGSLRCLVNVNVLTEGFDAPHVDLVVMLRPTESPGLYYQMVGRGLRTHPDKADCMVLDLAGNIERHGPIDRLNERITDKASIKGQGGEAPVRTCPKCQEIVLAALTMCPVCGEEFPRETARHSTVASNATPISGPKVVSWRETTRVEYCAWTKKDAPEGHPKTLRVDYFCGPVRVVSEWVCVEHAPGSLAHGKALEWMEHRLRPGWLMVWDGSKYCLRNDDGYDLPITAADLEDYAAEAFRCPVSVGTTEDGKYDRIVDWKFAVDDEDDLDPVPVGAWIDTDDEPPF